MTIQTTPGTVKGDHVLMTGPVTGTVTKADGTVVDVGPAFIAVADQDEADEISFLIGERHVEQGHPDDRELDMDPESPTYGQMVQRPFVHAHDEKFNDHPAKFQGEPAGIPHETPEV